MDNYFLAKVYYSTNNVALRYENILEVNIFLSSYYHVYYVTLLIFCCTYAHTQSVRLFLYSRCIETRGVAEHFL